MPRFAIMILIAVFGAGASTAHARTLEVGAVRSYATLAAAVHDMHDGDTIAIDPGRYFECALITASRVRIAGSGPGVILSDAACGGKAALVISGNDVELSDLTITRIRVPDGNGAGVRMEGSGLTVQGCRFVNDQVAILAGDARDGAVRIRDSAFLANGAATDGRPTHGVLVGKVGLLQIERSDFRDARGGDHVVSSAAETELIGNRFSDDGKGMTGPMVTIGDGGAALVADNTFVLEAGSGDRTGVILLAADGDDAATSLAFRGNVLIDRSGRNAPFVRNWTGESGVFDANTIPAGSMEQSVRGAFLHRLRVDAVRTKQALRSAAGGMKRTLRSWIGD